MAEWPIWFQNILTICMGLVIGSFLNVVVVRLPENKSVVSVPSHCISCGKRIAWYDNVPVLSYLLLKGECRVCHQKISVRYPIIELLTAFVFFASKAKFGLSLELVFKDWVFLSLLIAITFIDLEHRIIPDELSLGGLAFGLLTCWMTPNPGWEKSLLGAGIGFGLFYLTAWAYLALRKRHGLGGGDIKLLAMLGAFLGPTGVFVTILVSSVFGTLVGLGLALFLGKKKEMMKMSLPYGPFLVVGAIYYYLFGDSLWLQFMTPI